MQNIDFQIEDNGTFSAIARFMLKIFGFVIFLLSSLLVSIIAYQCTISSWAFSKYYSDSSLDFLITIFPFKGFFITIFLAISTVLLFKFIYRHHAFYFSFALVLFTVLICASMFYYSGLAKIVNDRVNHFEFYSLFSNHDYIIWSSPERGLLSGQIGIINDVNDFLLIDYTGKTWIITGNNPTIADNTVIGSGNQIKIIGRQNQDNVFVAKIIKPY